VKGTWKYLYRPFDKKSKSVDFLLTGKRDKAAAKPMLNFKSFRSAKKVLAGIELMHMIRKGQMAAENQMSFAEQFMRRQDKSIQYEVLHSFSPKYAFL
jgi:transposase-like protein